MTIAASAGQLCIADSILTEDSPDAIRYQLPPSTRQHQASAPDLLSSWLTRYAPSCSSGLQAACQSLLRSHTKSG